MPCTEKYYPMPPLRWQDINTWRLSQHYLLRPTPQQEMLAVASQLCGIHAQVMSSAEMTLQVRVANLSSTEIQHALWHNRTLIKTWAMRGTLHLITTQ